MTYLTTTHQTPPAHINLDGMLHPTAEAIATHDLARLAELGIWPHETADGPAPLGHTPWVEMTGGQGHYYWREPLGTAEEIAAALVEQKRQELQGARTHQRLVAQTGGFSYEGRRYASDREESIPLLTAATITAQLSLAQGLDATSAFEAALGAGWRDMEGVPRIATALGILGLHAAFVAHGAACDRHSQALKAALEAAASLEDLTAVEVGAGWPT